MHRLIELVENLGRPKLALVGDFMLDRYVYGDVERINPEAPVPVLRVVRSHDGVGGAGNVAAAASALGAGVCCVGSIGEDAAGDELHRLLAATGADASPLIRLRDRRTAIKTRYIGLAQHRHAQQMLRVDEEPVEPLRETVQASIRAAARNCAAQADVVVLEDYNKGLFTDELTPRIISDAVKAGKRVIVDPAPIRDYRKYCGCTLLKPNRYETALASGIEIADPATLAQAAERLLDLTEAQAVLITLDRQGAYLHRRQGGGQLIPHARPREVYEVTGAGDESLAALAVAMAAGADYVEAAELANVAGGLEVERIGFVPITRQEVLNELMVVQKAASGKVIGAKELAAEVKRLLGAGKRIVFTNGCFDLIHAGHVQYLSFARSQGDVLVVGLNSDASVRRIKGPGRPVVGQEDRSAVLAALESVDYVCLFDEDTPIELIRRVAQGPITLIKGEDWRDKGVVGQDVVEARGGRVVLAPLVPGRSTTRIVEKIGGKGKRKGV